MGITVHLYSPIGAQIAVSGIDRDAFVSEKRRLACLAFCTVGEYVFDSIEWVLIGFGVVV